MPASFKPFKPPNAPLPAVTVLPSAVGLSSAFAIASIDCWNFLADSAKLFGASNPAMPPSIDFIHFSPTSINALRWPISF